MFQETLTFRTRGRGLTSITGQVVELVARSGVATGASNQRPQQGNRRDGGGMNPQFDIPSPQVRAIVLD